ncbi:5-oxoprolinase subunit PxpA [Thalassobellus suaedae]|uniref:5-oxoprolinase subunit PxpA n=1 Tax=Thalassobellus suaedae TaxID=3074124 RepID=A0ABY9XXT1_9FLAO|nr:5-oxoprolinase subunit PxpA [Flavobacteriaceae bacterium HL-DH14]
MNNFSIDINVDVGEGVGNESQLMPLVSSCNIACGGHAGDNVTMRSVVKLAKQHRVKIGAHPSFPDKENFGRVKMDLSCTALFATLKHQIEDLLSILREEHITLHHVKPHGALYNLVAVDKKAALVIIEVMKSFVDPIKLYVPFQSVIASLALENNIPIVYEAFADRNYNADLSLVSRTKKEALIRDTDVMFKHVYGMILNQKVIAVTGESVPIKAETFCIHGDNFNAVSLLKKLRINLEKEGVKIR